MSNTNNEPIKLFKNKDTNELSEEFVLSLSKCSNPHLICIYGPPRIGKSTKMNQIINGMCNDNIFTNCNKPFETGDSAINPVTDGCDVYGPVMLNELAERNGIDGKQMNNCELFFVDTEGLNALDGNKGNSNNCVCGILSLMQLCTMTIAFLKDGSKNTVIEANKCSSLGKIFDLNIGKDNSNDTKKSVIFAQLDVKCVDQNNKEILPDEVTSELFEMSIKHTQKETQDCVEKIVKKTGDEEKRNFTVISLPNWAYCTLNNEVYVNTYKCQMKNFVENIISECNFKAKPGNELIEDLETLVGVFGEVKSINDNISEAIEELCKENFRDSFNEKLNVIEKEILQMKDKFITFIEQNERMKGSDILKQYIQVRIKELLSNKLIVLRIILKDELDDLIEYCCKFGQFQLAEILKDCVQNDLVRIKGEIETTEINSLFKKISESEYRFEITPQEIEKGFIDSIKKIEDKYKLFFIGIKLIDEKQNYMNNLRNSFELFIQVKMNMLKDFGVSLARFVQIVNDEIINIIQNLDDKKFDEYAEKFKNDHNLFDELIEKIRVEMKFNILDQNEYNTEMKRLKGRVNEMITSKSRSRKQFLDQLNYMKEENDRLLKVRDEKEKVMIQMLNDKTEQVKKQYEIALKHQEELFKVQKEQWEKWQKERDAEYQRRIDELNKRIADLESSLDDGWCSIL